MAFLVTGKDTKHTSMFDWTIPARFSTGRHVHRVQEETFYVIDGECEWHIGEEVVRATPGTFVFIPPGVPHNIANITDNDTGNTHTLSTGVGDGSLTVEVNAFGIFGERLADAEYDDEG